MMNHIDAAGLSFVESASCLFTFTSRHTPFSKQRGLSAYFCEFFTCILRTNLLGSSLPSCKSSLVLPLLNLAATVSEDSEINAVMFDSLPLKVPNRRRTLAPPLFINRQLRLVTLPTALPRPSPSFTMSNSSTVILTPAQHLFLFQLSPMSSISDDEPTTRLRSASTSDKIIAISSEAGSRHMILPVDGAIS
jgi:hypothetical protein